MRTQARLQAWGWASASNPPQPWGSRSPPQPASVEGTWGDEKSLTVDTRRVHGSHGHLPRAIHAQRWPWGPGLGRQHAELCVSTTHRGKAVRARLITRPGGASLRVQMQQLTVHMEVTAGRVSSWLVPSDLKTGSGLRGDPALQQTCGPSHLPRGDLLQGSTPGTPKHSLASPILISLHFRRPYHPLSQLLPTCVSFPWELLQTLQAALVPASLRKQTTARN